MTNTDLSQANLQRTDLSGANLKNANLTNVQIGFTYCNEQTVLPDGFVCHNNFIKTNSEKKTKDLKLGRPQVQKATFRELLKNNKCIGCDLSRIILADFPEWSSHSFKGAILNQSNLNGADLNKINLEDASLTYASLNGVYLTRANLKNAQLQYSSIRGSSLCLTNLENANLDNTDLRGTTLTNANLKNTKCNAQTQFPIGYTCENGLVTIGNVACNANDVLPVGYICENGSIREEKISGCPEDSESYHPGKTVRSARPVDKTNVEAKKI